MPLTTLPYHQTGYFSDLICDYLAQKPALRSFYGEFPSLEAIKKQLHKKEKSFTTAQRTILVEALKKQYKGVAISEATQDNLKKLHNNNTFTISTGHQLNLFTGPLYFLYKIISVINFSEQAKKEYPSYDFVPVYWMATEDHDFDEINYFNFKGDKIEWDRNAGGAVGDLDTDGLEEVLELFSKQSGGSDFAKELQQLFKNAYVAHNTLAAATRFLGNELFKKYGLVIVDGNDSTLKKQFAPFVEKELLLETSHKEITKTTSRLTSLGYPEQVHPRELNLFYLKKGLRERIIKKENTYYINETEISFSESEILQELKNHPERFSPNALLRPLYQEVILPNLCYTGGGGELAYWFQLKDYFETVEVPFPLLLLRNSALLIPSKQLKKLEKMDIDVVALFLNQQDFKEKVTRQYSDIDIDFSKQKEHLKQQFEALYDLAKKTDASFIGAVAAQEQKQCNGLDHLEKRLMKAQKRKLADVLNRATSLQDEVFPKQSLQERNTNFASFYLELGKELIPLIKKQLQPLQQDFTVIELP